jgi:hypothetical protein
MNTFSYHFIKGIRYAFLFIMLGAVMGAIFGIWSGIVYGPAVFAVSLTGLFVVLNFPISLLLFLLNLLPQLAKKGSSQLNRYFIYSSAFLLVYMLFFFLFKLLDLRPF